MAAAEAGPKKARLDGRKAGLLFPSVNGKPFSDLRGSLDKVFELANVDRPEGIAWHLFRHTYTAMRIQTLDNGQPITLWAVKTELGHRSTVQIENTYGHLMKIRHRTETVDYLPLKIERQGRRRA